MCSGNPKKSSCRRFRPTPIVNLKKYWGAACAATRTNSILDARTSHLSSRSCMNNQPISSRATSQWLPPSLADQAASAHARVQKASATQLTVLSYLAQALCANKLFYPRCNPPGIKIDILAMLCHMSFESLDFAYHLGVDNKFTYALNWTQILLI